MNTRIELTKQAKVVLSLVARGWRTDKIAEELFLSPRTVETISLTSIQSWMSHRGLKRRCMPSEPICVRLEKYVKIRKTRPAFIPMLRVLSSVKPHELQAEGA